jgi:hypothetical protein
MNKTTLVLLTIFTVTSISIATASAQNGRGRSGSGPMQLNLSETPYGGACETCPNSGRAMGSRAGRGVGMGQGRGQSMGQGQGQGMGQRQGQGMGQGQGQGMGRGLAGLSGRGCQQKQTAQRSCGTRGQTFSTGRRQNRGTGSDRSGVSRQRRGRKGRNTNGNLRRGARAQGQNRRQRSQCGQQQNRHVGRSGRRCGQGRRQTAQQSCGKRGQAFSMGRYTNRKIGFGGCGASQQGGGRKGRNENSDVRRGACGQGRGRGQCGR